MEPISATSGMATSLCIEEMIMPSSVPARYSSAMLALSRLAINMACEGSTKPLSFNCLRISLSLTVCAT